MASAKVAGVKVAGAERAGAAPGIRRVALARHGRTVASFAGLIALWIVAAWLTEGRGGLVPQPGAVIAKIVDDGFAFYAPNIGWTLSEAVLGFLWGNGLALLLAALVLVLPWLNRIVMQLAVVSYCIPIIAIGPLLTIVFADRQPMIALSALSVFFTTLVGALMGLQAADKASLDVVRVYGGGRVKQLRYVRIAAALPSIFSALSLAAPASLLGAIVGEWLGSVQEGLGVAMVVSMQQMMADRTWSIAVVCGVLAGAGYALVALIGRIAMPWSADLRARH